MTIGEGLCATEGDSDRLVGVIVTVLSGVFAAAGGSVGVIFTVSVAGAVSEITVLLPGVWLSERLLLIATTHITAVNMPATVKPAGSNIFSAADPRFDSLVRLFEAMANS